MRELAVALFGLDQPLKGIGISLLRELVQNKVELPRHELKIVCITDDDGYQFHNGIKQLGHAVHNDVMIAKVPFSDQKNQYADLLALMYKNNTEILVIDMIKTPNLEKMGLMLDACYDLNLSLVSVVSRPPSFRTKASSLLKLRYKCFSKPPEIRKVIACIKELSKLCVPDALPKNILLKYSLIEKDIIKFEKDLPDQERYQCLKMTSMERYAILDKLMLNPLSAMECIECREWKYAAGMSYLIGLGTCLPVDVNIESVNGVEFDQNAGFGEYFASLDAQRTLIAVAKQSNMENSIEELAVYLECLLQFVKMKSFKVLVLFVESGGLELISYRSGGLLHHPDQQISKFAHMITCILIHNNLYKRRCVTCGDLEKQQGQWDTCSKCKGVLYCSVTCQYHDWIKCHFKSCLPYPQSALLNESSRV